MSTLTNKFSPQQRENSFFGLITLNGHILCAVDVETTGLDPELHDIIQLAVIPLNAEIKPHKAFTPFNMYIKPGRPENIDGKAIGVTRTKLADIMVQGFESAQVLDLFLNWFDRFKLREGGKMTPLGHNYAFDVRFLRAWLGDKLYDDMFNYHPRDTMSIMNFLNDRAIFCGQLAPYTSYSLKTGCLKHDIPYTAAHDAFEDAKMTAELYQRLLSSLHI